MRRRENWRGVEKTARKEGRNMGQRRNGKSGNGGQGGEERGSDRTGMK